MGARKRLPKGRAWLVSVEDSDVLAHGTWYVSDYVAMLVPYSDRPVLPTAAFAVSGTGIDMHTEDGKTWKAFHEGPIQQKRVEDLAKRNLHEGSRATMWVANRLVVQVRDAYHGKDVDAKLLQDSSGSVFTFMNRDLFEIVADTHMNTDMVVRTDQVPDDANSGFAPGLVRQPVLFIDDDVVAFIAPLAPSGEQVRSIEANIATAADTIVGARRVRGDLTEHDMLAEREVAHNA